MFARSSHAHASFCGTFPTGIEARYESENRMVWNELQHTREERELIYEVTWIAELGIWRRFLRSQRTVKR